MTTYKTGDGAESTETMNNKVDGQLVNSLASQFIALGQGEEAAFRLCYCSTIRFKDWRANTTKYRCTDIRTL